MKEVLFHYLPVIPVEVTGDGEIGIDRGGVRDIPDKGVYPRGVS